ncbi:MAG: outer membrane protein transport protein [Thiobacillaceae bacterium]
MNTQEIKQLGFAVGLITLPALSLASGFALTEQNASGLGNAYAGQAASAQDASTIYFNPAGMMLLPASQLVLAGHLIKPSMEFSNSGSTPAPLQTLGGNGGDAGGVIFVPSLYYTHPVNDRLALGISVNAPFGLKTDYDPSWMGRFLAVKSEVKTININPSLAYKLNETVSVGLGIDYQKIDATLTSMTNYSAAAGGGLGPNLQGLATVKGHDYGWGWNLGGLVNLGTTRVGLAYRSKIDYTLGGDVSFDSVPAALSGAIANSPITAAITLPASASVSLFHTLSPTFALLADVTWTGWSAFNKLAVYRTSGALVSSTTENWDDTMRYSIGINYKPGNAWTWRTGVAYDKTPVPDLYRTARIPDQDRTWIALGGQYRLDQLNAIDFGYAHLFFKNADMTNSLNNTSASAGTGTLNGTYKDSVDILSVQYTHSF